MVLVLVLLLLLRLVLVIRVDFASVAWGRQSLLLQVNFVLAEIHLHWPVKDNEHVDVEVEHG